VVIEQPLSPLSYWLAARAPVETLTVPSAMTA
jgi:hypothetical protein